MISGGHQNEFYVRVDEDSWRATGVDKAEMHRRIDVAIISFNQRGSDFRFGIKRYPRPVCGGEFVSADVKLAGHDLSLFPQGGDGLVSLGRRTAHFLQLSINQSDLLLIENMTAAPLNKSNYGVRGNEQQRKKTYPITKFSEIAGLLAISCIGFYVGLPRRNWWGILITCAALVCFMSGFAVALTLLP